MRLQVKAMGHQCAMRGSACSVKMLQMQGTGAFLEHVLPCPCIEMDLVLHDGAFATCHQDHGSIVAT